MKGHITNFATNVLASDSSNRKSIAIPSRTNEVSMITAEGQDIGKLVQKRLKTTFYILLVLFWVAQIWAPVDTSVTYGIENNFQKIFNHPLFGLRVVYPFGIITIMLTFNILYVFRDYYFKNKFYNRFFVLSLVMGCISLLNPNNDLISMKYYAVRPAIFYFVYLFFLFSITLLQKDICIILLRKIFKVGLIIGFLRALYSLVSFLIGKGMLFMNRNVTISHGDTLLWMTIFHVILLALYFDLKKKRYLFYSIIFFLTLLFSYRRSALLLAVVTDICFLTFVLFYAKDKFNIIIFYGFLGVSIALFSFVGTQFISQDKLTDFKYRYKGAFFCFSDQAAKSRIMRAKREYSDSGHFNTSINTTKTFFNNIDTFWGRGYVGRKGFYVKGQTLGGVHNSFVDVWAYYGLYMTFYLIAILVLLFKQSIIQFKTLNNKSISSQIYIKSSIIFYLTLYIIMGWFNGACFIGTLQYYTQFVLLFAVFKIDSRNVKYLFV